VPCVLLACRLLFGQLSTQSKLQSKVLLWHTTWRGCMYYVYVELQMAAVPACNFADALTAGIL
jgi:hypothetical protein